MPAAPARPAAAETIVRPAGNGGTRPATTRPAAPSPRPAPIARPAATPPRAPAASLAEPAEETGWVSDLLRRASRDEEPVPAAAEPAARVPETNGSRAPAEPASAKVEPEQPLGGFSVDIARAIDHDASVELWERHRRGEHNVFTRRLYTLQGQQTFDEIRKKYQRDEQFRTAVDRYIADFEKLLDDVTRTRDRAASNAYLVSDTGKVYTMLAHASGRFD
jgi:hypothetical protein